MTCLKLFLVFCIPLSTAVAAPLPYAPAPNDTYWSAQWYLENIDTNAIRNGVDMNAREAWGITRGAGVTIAIVDNGVELSHLDLTNQAVPSLHWDFYTDEPSGLPHMDFQAHGTAVAGLAIATQKNNRGMSGIAPDARFASWVIFKTNRSADVFVSDEQLARMFQFNIQDVHIQNHSWLKEFGPGLMGITLAEHLAISNAVTAGRGGKGVVIVRAAGNLRFRGRNVNEDAYVNDPRVISVAAVRSSGRATSYSNPGAPVLVSGTSGDLNYGFANVFSTDRLGQKGFNEINFFNDLADYVFASLGFSGTSAAAPLVSGIAALALSVNPQLHYRDVQQLLILASQQKDPDDPDLIANGAGYLVSHNTGFGLVDAGRAVELARDWVSRPAQTNITYSIIEQKAVPDAGLRVQAGLLSVNLLDIIALPSVGPEVDENTPALPMVYVGTATQAVTLDLTNKAALIDHTDPPSWATQIANVAAAGAEFAVVRHYTNGTQLLLMEETDFVPIPAVFITENDGRDLHDFVQNNSLGTVRLAVNKTGYDFNVSETLLCEHVSVRIASSYPVRGDLRITLVSPQGTRSVLQRLNQDLTPGPQDWIYSSTHHFYESSAGQWKVEFIDQIDDTVGDIEAVSLQISGVSITDIDRDGLDDAWEMAEFSTLARGPKDDIDGDGDANSREQILRTPAATASDAFAVTVAPWAPLHVRLAWQSKPGAEYEIYGGSDLAQPLTLLTNIPGGFPHTVWFEKTSTHRFYKVLQRR